MGLEKKLSVEERKNLLKRMKTNGEENLEKKNFGSRNTSRLSINRSLKGKNKREEKCENNNDFLPEYKEINQSIITKYEAIVEEREGIKIAYDVAKQIHSDMRSIYVIYETHGIPKEKRQAAYQSLLAQTQRYVSKQAPLENRINEKYSSDKEKIFRGVVLKRRKSPSGRKNGNGSN